ncbi:CBO0543 family protein [Aquibacillus salsiterrae]|uniref:Uncharacterized protein n=1 Tax=Aquibacillus salsiterrae TaxID=2950439 RepID=A0A9X4ADR4_9BACI|nr:CBO0543 family protein [Aquibacillus salsiterrae]MDC3415837.1 hypothetical protein [Aquibacillus salsiterrae]
MNTYDKIIQNKKEAIELHNNYWLSEVVYSYQWWLIITLLIVPWILWFILTDRSRKKKQLIVGLIVMIVSYLMDQIGSAMLLWHYPYTLTPLERSVFDPVDLSVLPVSYMLIYQYFTKISSYLTVAVLFSFCAAFIGGNLAEAIHVYDIINWQHIFSVPIYFSMFVLLRLIVKKLE